MKAVALVPAQKALAIFVRAFYCSAAALSLGLLALTPGAASAQIIEYEFVSDPSTPYPTGVLYDNTANTSPGLTGYVGTVAAGYTSTFTVAPGQTFDMDVGAIIEGVPQLFAGIGVNDDLIQTVGGDNLILGNEQTSVAAQTQLWELTTNVNGLNGLVNIGLGSWQEVGVVGGGTSSAPDGGSTIVLTLGSLMLLGAVGRRFNRAPA